MLPSVAMRIYNIFLSLNIWVFCGLICQSIGCHLFTARKGDVVFFEKGEKIRFVTDEGCSVFFVTFPLMIETVKALKKEKEQQEQAG